MKYQKFPLAFLIASLLASWSLTAGTVSLPSVADTGLHEFMPTANFEMDTRLRAGTLGPNGGTTRNRALFKFDPIGAIPPGSIITSAQLSLTVSQAGNVGIYEFQLRRLLVPWTENGATWLIRQTGVAWTAPGGAPGTDYSSVVSGSEFVFDDATYQFGSTPQMATDVQGWLDSPASNHGWMLLTTAESTPQSVRRFYSRESSIEPPDLIVQYVPGFRIDFAERVGNEIRIHFPGRAGQSYRVQCRDDIASGMWLDLTTLGPQANDGEVVFSETIGTAPRFYRVGEL